MEKPQYAILRFAKYKGPEIGSIEAHDERTKEKYASNDIRCIYANQEWIQIMKKSRLQKP